LQPAGIVALFFTCPILHLSTIEVTTADTFNRVMTVNALGTFLGMRACLALMRERRAGSIVNIGSIDSIQGTPATAGYTASKFAVLGLTKVAAIELGKFGIRANCICPAAGSDEMLTDAITVPEPDGLGVGPTSTEETTFEPASTGDEPFWPQPIPRRGYPADVVGAALFFASDDSAFCTGASLLVDGGHTAGHYISVPGVFTA
jgi:3alpha(or 20beta)-hydroxysteroid dehydrogenase